MMLIKSIPETLNKIYRDHGALTPSGLWCLARGWHSLEQPEKHVLHDIGLVLVLRIKSQHNKLDI